MAHPFRITGIIALAATAACSPSADLTAPSKTSPVFARADAHASSHTVVTESDITRQPENTPPTDNWVFYYRIPVTSSGVFVSGPGNPPLGTGSFDMGTPTVGDKTTLFNYDHIGTELADITDISYATYRHAPSTGGVALPSINVQVDRDGGAFIDGDFLTLVYEPYVDGKTIQDGVWQTWETIPGTWWASTPIILDGTVCARQSCTFSWNEFVEAYPNATIVGGFGVNQGSFNAGLFAATDALSITYGSTWTYDFELFRSPKDACKDGGWETMTRANGSPFKNQGQCVKYHQENSGGSDET